MLQLSSLLAGSAVALWRLLRHERPDGIGELRRGKRHRPFDERVEAHVVPLSPLRFDEVVSVRSDLLYVALDSGPVPLRSHGGEKHTGNVACMIVTASKFGPAPVGVANNTFAVAGSTASMSCPVDKLTWFSCGQSAADSPPTAWSADSPTVCGGRNTAAVRVTKTVLVPVNWLTQRGQVDGQQGQRPRHPSRGLAARCRGCRWWSLHQPCHFLRSRTVKAGSVPAQRSVHGVD
jgi:hypothetical protein